MTAGLRGLTWDHPRGYVVLDSMAAAGGGPPPSNSPAAGRPAAGPPPSSTPIHWDRQPLEGFESRPLRTLADDYDLLVIDHPGLGEAVRDQALRPLGTLLSEAELNACETVSAGRSYASYQLAGQQWALPLDAAAQVSVCRPDLMAERPPTWEDARRAARRYHTAVGLGGPHALLMFAAICVSLGAPPATSPGEPAFADPTTGTEALQLMADLVAHADPRLAGRNPIAVLDAMAAGDQGGGGPVYCPLVYGYVSYQRPHPRKHALAAFDAPAGRGGNATGSVLGGTGIAVTRSCTQLGAARDHILRLMSEEVQIGLYRELGGQSADRRAWLDPEADRRSGGFYSATRRTVEAAWVRPRFAGYVAFQVAASAVLRDGLLQGERPAQLLSRVNDLFARAGEAAAVKNHDTAMTRRSG